ncbi:MAG: hypothetical protein Q8O87_00625 [bacterium]|nr:hypothetical protein [bacterium]
MNNAKLIITSMIIASLIIIMGIIFVVEDKDVSKNGALITTAETLDIIIPIRWGDLGMKMVNAGVIDPIKLNALYNSRGGLTTNGKGLTKGGYNGPLVINAENANYILNLLWAFGLSNKNSLLDNGPISDAKYGTPGRFASTGGWTLANGNAMEHFSAHKFINLTPPQQALVDEMAKNIHRPCCNNPTHFPDCNHGMAMLGLLELMAANDLTEKEMYDIALRVNALWFPSQYKTIAHYLSSDNQSHEPLEPKEILGSQFSSAAGYQKIVGLINQPRQNGGNGCGV